MFGFDIYCQHKRHRGFTVVELMVGVAIVAILAAVAAPNLSQFITNQEIKAQSDEIGRTFAVARAESLSRLQDISVCWNPSDANVTQSGVVIAPNHMAVLDPDGVSAEIIRYVEYTGDGLFVVEDEADNCAIIDTQGRLDLSSVTGNTLVFGVCEATGVVKNSRSIVVSNTGRATVDKNVQTDGTNTINCS